VSVEVYCCLHVDGQVLYVGWGDSAEWNGDDHWAIYVWFNEPTTDWDMYKGFRHAGAPCSGALVVRAPSVDPDGVYLHPQGIAALMFRQVCLVHGTAASQS
jgi:hypothetical protein